MTSRSKVPAALLLLWIAIGASCSDDGHPPDPCEGVTCSGHGNCVALDGAPSCDCDPGFKPGQLSCLALAPCEGETCSGHGTCQVVDGREICECDPGYAPDDLECKPIGDCLQTGLECLADQDCCDGFCLKYDGDPTGYCTRTDCKCKCDCVNHADDGSEMCCVDVGGEHYLCMKIFAGYTCADERICGHKCADDPCARCITCVPDRNGTEYYTHQCATDPDCGYCHDPRNPDLTFTCQPTEDGMSYCLPWYPDECTSSLECEGGEVCLPLASTDGQSMVGDCKNLGQLPVGSACDSRADPNELSPAERCAGFYCLWDHCTEVCGQDADCSDGMVCNETFFCMDADCETVAPIGMCKWTCCGLIPCDSNADCPDGKICDYYLPPDGEITKVCALPRCDPAGQNCGAVGDACGVLPAECSTGLCLRPVQPGPSFCSALCATDQDCPDPLVCLPTQVATSPSGVPMTIDACRPPE